MQSIALLCPEGDKVCFIGLGEGELVNMRAGSDVVRCQIRLGDLEVPAVGKLDGKGLYAVGLNVHIITISNTSIAVRGLVPYKIKTINTRG